MIRFATEMVQKQQGQMEIEQHPPKNLMRVSFRIVCTLALTLLVGCGFHLRGSGNLDTIRGPVFVYTPAFSELADELRQVLRDSEIELTERGAQAAIQTRIEREDLMRRVVGVGADNSLRGIELHFTLRLTVTRTDETYQSVRQLAATREFEFDTTGVLGSSDEEELLLEEIRRELVRDILGYLALASRENSE